MRILVDLDGIVTDTLPTWLKRIRELTGTFAKPEEITKWNMNENAPLANVDPKVLFGILNEVGFNRNLPQMPDAAHYLHQLHKAGHDVSLVTARYGTVCMPETIEWVKAVMPWLRPDKKLWFIGDKHRITGDVLIDDKAETLIEYHKTCPEAHLITIDYPYNKHAPNCTYRVEKNGYEWEQIEQIVTRLNEDRCLKCGGPYHGSKDHGYGEVDFPCPN